MITFRLKILAKLSVSNLLLNRLLFIGVLCICQALSTHAQITQADSLSLNKDTTRTDDLYAIDTVPIKWMFSYEPQKYYYLSDTLLGASLYQFDETRKVFPFKAHLGNIASATTSLWYEPNIDTSLVLGSRSWQFYDRSAATLPYYTSNKPYSNVYFSQGLKQNDGLFSAAFGRRFARNTLLSFDYSRVNNEGLYLWQRNLNTHFRIGVQFKSKNERYTAFVAYATNTWMQQQNGGITTDSLFADSRFDSRALYPIYEQNAIIRRNSRTFLFTQHYNLNRDSTAKLRLRLTHSLMYETSYHKFYDTSVKTDTLLYDSIYLIESRGLRSFNSYRRLNNDIFVSIDNAHSSPFKVGLSWDSYKYIVEPDSNLNTNMLRLIASGGFPIGKWLQISSKGHLYLTGYKKGDFFANASTQIRINKNLIIDASWNVFRNSPLINEDLLYVSSKKIWDQKLNATFGSGINGEIYFPQWKLKLWGSSSVVSNLIYFDTSGVPQQFNKAISVSQLTLSKLFNFKTIHFNNSIALQGITERTILPLPSILSEHDLYYEGLVFKKKMLLRTGFSVRFVNQFSPYGYNIITGNFKLQDEYKFNALPQMDVYLTFKVQRFRGFLKMEQVNTFFGNDVWQLVYPYPVFDKSFRFGINWQLSN